MKATDIYCYLRQDCVKRCIKKEEQTLYKLIQLANLNVLLRKGRSFWAAKLGEIPEGR